MHNHFRCKLLKDKYAILRNSKILFSFIFILIILFSFHSALGAAQQTLTPTNEEQNNMLLIAFVLGIISILFLVVSIAFYTIRRQQPQYIIEQAVEQIRQAYIDEIKQLGKDYISASQKFTGQPQQLEKIQQQAKERQQQIKQNFVKQLQQLRQRYQQEQLKGEIEKQAGLLREQYINETRQLGQKYMQLQQQFKQQPQQMQQMQKQFIERQQQVKQKFVQQLQRLRQEYRE